MFCSGNDLADVKLPAVSGSSGHLVVERVKDVGQEPDYPGKVFADAELGYADAVQAFVEALSLFSARKLGLLKLKKYLHMQKSSSYGRKRADYASSGAIFASAANWKMQLGE